MILIFIWPLLESDILSSWLIAKYDFAEHFNYKRYTISTVVFAKKCKNGKPSFKGSSYVTAIYVDIFVDRFGLVKLMFKISLEETRKSFWVTKSEIECTFRTIVTTLRGVSRWPGAWANFCPSQKYPHFTVAVLISTTFIPDGLY